MTAETNRDRETGWHHSPYTWLLLVLIVLLVSQPFLSSGSWASVVSNLLFSGLLLAAVAAANRRRSVLIPCTVLAIAGLGFRWWDWADHSSSITLLALLPSSLLLLVTSGSIVLAVARQTRVSRDTISGGVCIYLLMGITWALLMSALQLIVPGSFAGGGTPLAPPTLGGHSWFGEFLYFSFVTLTTLGYGDIGPTTPAARMLAAAEAVVGQLYIAIFIARLVGLYTAATAQESEL